MIGMKVKTIKGDENTPHEVIWQDSFENVRIHYIEDFYIGIAPDRSPW